MAIYFNSPLNQLPHPSFWNCQGATPTSTAFPQMGGIDTQLVTAMLTQLLQCLSSLQSSWGGMLGQSHQTQAQYCPPTVPFPTEPSPTIAETYTAPAPEPEPVPEVQVAAAVETQAVVDTSFSGGGDGGDGGGGDGGDPIILDLNGDNQLDVTGADGQKINFNLFGNGTDVKTEWLKKGTQDGLLVSDFNGDGQIDSGRELMRTTGVNGEQGKYSGGWDKLSQLFDTNHDGKVSGSELDKLQVWVDADGDGVSDEGELRSVKDSGISEIDIPGDGVKSTFTVNGKQQLAEDYVFDIET